MNEDGKRGRGEDGRNDVKKRKEDRGRMGKEEMVENRRRPEEEEED